MTKKELKWRLSELPTGGEVADLVSEGVITKEEARSILFNEGESPATKVKELEEEVKFLREICDKLAAKSNGWTTIIKEYRDYVPRYPVWHNTYSTVTKPNLVHKVTAGSLTTGTLGMQNVSQTQMFSKLTNHLAVV